jgi:hypothetical protein
MKTLISLFAGIALLTTPLLADQASAQSLPNLPILAGVQLSAQQKEQVTQIWISVYPKIQAVLSDAQRSQFKTDLDQGESVRNALMNLDLSLKQKLQLRAIMQSIQQQVSGIMAPQQRQQIEQNARSL